MAKQAVDQPQLPTHGAAILPSVTVDSNNLEIEDEDGFVGDKATKGAFSDLLDKWRQPLKEVGQDSALRSVAASVPQRTTTARDPKETRQLFGGKGRGGTPEIIDHALATGKPFVWFVAPRDRPPSC